MRQVTKLSPAVRNRPAAGLVTAALVGALVILTAAAASAAGTVSKLVFNPTPVGTTSSVTAGSSVAVTLTAEDSSGIPVPGGTVFLAFQQTPGGGTAFVGTKGLTLKPTMFIADSGGHVAITYSTPPSYPASGCDDIKAQNGPTRATSTAVNDDAFCFSPISALNFTPKPIARRGSLGASSHVTVTLTVFAAGGARLANGTVWLGWKADNPASGANAVVNGVTLTKTLQAFTTNSSGQVFINYSTGTILPTSGSDKISAANDGKFGTITATDAYQY